MRVRFKNNHNIKAFANSFNLFSISEITIYIIKPHYDCDSVFIKDVEVLIYGLWIDLNLAFCNKDVITDDYNRVFFKPMNWNDRLRGYTL